MKQEKRIKIWSSNQIGFMITWGANYEKRPYVCFDVPFWTVQIFLKDKPKKHEEPDRPYRI